MNHPFELLQAAFDNELSASELIILQQHLQNCESCRALLAEQHNIHALLMQSKSQLVPASLNRAIEQRIRQARAPKARSGWRVQALFLLICSVFSWFYWPELLSLAQTIGTASEALIVWIFSTTSGLTGAQLDSAISFEAQGDLVLVVGLCVILLACILVLQQEVHNSHR